MTPTQNEKPARVLCVDDDPMLLTSVQRNLRRHFNVAVAPGGREALEVLRKDKSFAVIICDMRMPGMDGAEFFSQAKLLVPDAVRVLLTGQADFEAVISAINDGRIFRYLSKPIEKDQLVQVVEASLVHYRLVREEKEAALEAVRGGLAMALNLLEGASPAAWGRAMRTRKMVAALGTEMGLANTMALEAAAVLAQCDEVFGRPHDMAVIEQLVSSFPQLADAADFVREVWTDQKSGIASRILYLAQLVDAQQPGSDPADVLEASSHSSGPDARLAIKLLTMVPQFSISPSATVNVSELKAGHTLYTALRFRSGAVFCPHGVAITPLMVNRIKAFGGTLEQTAQLAEVPLPVEAVEEHVDEPTRELPSFAVAQARAAAASV